MVLVKGERRFEHVQDVTTCDVMVTDSYSSLLPVIGASTKTQEVCYGTIYR